MVTLYDSRGLPFTVSVEDFALVWSRRWETNKAGYLQIRVRVDGKQKWVSLHRLLMDPGALSVDHVDGDPRNNQRSNLRLATQAQNMRNVRAHKDNAAGLKGVSFLRGRAKPWRARVMCAGYYATAQEAHEAYKRGAERLHGEFARSA